MIETFKNKSIRLQTEETCEETEETKNSRNIITFSKTTGKSKFNIPKIEKEEIEI